MIQNKISPKVRKLPFDMAKCLQKYPNVPSLLNELAGFPGGMAWALNRIGVSIYAEYGEMQLHYLHDRLQSFSGPDAKVLIKQELMHNGYHHILNKFIEPNYIKSKFGPAKMNALLYPRMAQIEMLYRKITNPASEAEREATIKHLEFRIVCFETEFSIFGAMSNLQVLDKCFDEVKEICPFFLYLWMYHWAEEMEHVHVSLDSYIAKHKEDPFSKDVVKKVFAEMEYEAQVVTSLALQVGLNNGIILDYKDFTELPAVKNLAALREKFKDGFNVDDFLEMRLYYIEKFDKKWEPQLREAVQKTISKAA